MNITQKIKSILLASTMILPWGNVKAAEDVRIPENRVIYEVFVRNFSPEGNFKGVEKQIPRLKELGIDVVWLMPIYKLGDIGKWGTYSSPYAVKDYKAIDPDNGTADDLHSLISTIHDNGMEVWFDWVGNHTSKDNVWVSSHPEYYGNNFYSPNGWSDVYQLDVNNTAMHEAMIDAMQYWVSEFDIDGYRCDYASGPSEDFWRKASQRVLKNGQRIAWLAEDDAKPELVTKGYFDYNYAWYFHDRLLDFGRGGNVNTLRNECANLHNEAAYNGRSRMVYLSNHDVVQDKGGTEDVLFHKYLKPLTVLEFTIYGMPLLYNGQEIQYKSGHVSLAEKTPIDWSNPDNSMTELIKKLTNLKHTQPALRTGSQHGALTNLSTNNDNNIYAFKRTLQNENVVVMLNFSDSQQTFTVNGGLPEGTYQDIFTGRTVDFSNPGSFTLSGQGYAVFINTVGGEITPPDPVDPDPIEESYIYIENKTGWDDLYLYGWYGEENIIKFFGEWPGISADKQESINGVTYQRFPVPTQYNGYTAHLIANDGKSEDARQNDFAYNVELGVNQYFSVGLPAEKHYIYLENNAGWSAVYVYAYNESTGEIESNAPLGAWPGTQASSTETINGKTYSKIEIPATMQEREYQFIVNDNNGNQLDLPAGKVDGDMFFEFGGLKKYSFYIVNNSGWSTLCLYGWANGKSELFGAWPGAQPTEQVTINNRTYDRYEIPADLAGETYNIIANNGVKDGSDKQQYDFKSLTLNRDYYFTLGNHLGNDNAQSFELNVDIHCIFFHNIQNWNNVYIYATTSSKSRAASTEEPFGEWPGTEATAFIKKGDYNLHILEIPAQANGNNYTITVHDNNNSSVSTTSLVDSDIYIDTNTTTSIDTVMDENIEPVYFDMRGIRIDNPSNGLFIEVKGTVARKVKL